MRADRAVRHQAVAVVPPHEAARRCPPDRRRAASQVGLLLRLHRRTSGAGRMAELSTEPRSSCCSTEQQASCCEPSAKASCCDARAAGGTCGCSAGSTAAESDDIRETVREKYAAA